MIEEADAQGARVRHSVDAVQSTPLNNVIAVARDYITLTKPRIISLLLLTTVTTMFVADPGGPAFTLILWTMLGGYLSAGGAGAINHYVDRERDAKMARTAARPLVNGRIAPRNGLIFGITLGVLAFFQLWLTVNFLAAALAMVGLLGYVFLYTVWLKPITPLNIVIGGSAGAVPPLVGWAAATGGLTLEALWPFLIIFFWTPPHFWALSLMIKEDYERTGVPMLPVVKGEPETRRQILIYTFVMVAVTLGPFFTGLLGTFYLISAILLGAIFTAFSLRLYLNPSKAHNLSTYLYSLAYLALLFVAMAVDAVA